ncbi:acyltransferase [Brevibacterium casei]|uniref:acyltransferase n=1 Tax=Brevibacterium casei TaxID=33889 RepID=UPI00167DF377|nr:acyltransferase [Brevibacterium casei]
MSIRIQESADVDPQSTIGDGSSVWHLAQVRDGAQLGKNVVVGRGAYIGSGVNVGDNSKIQNYALVYEPAEIAEGVFIGPAAVLTNDTFPRAINADGSQKSASDWEAVGVTIERGASIGARAVCVAPVTVGAWSTVAAGAVVTRDVAPYALVAGAPAKRIKWVGTSGLPLEQSRPGLWVDPSTGETYREKNGPEELEKITE